MYMRGILFSIEGPRQSFLWSTAWWRDPFADVPIFVTTLHQCMFGHPRKKATLLLHTLPEFLCLQRACNGKHQHEAWAFAKASAELAYPWDLAREMSTLVRKQLLDLGCSDAPQRLQDFDNLITGSRAFSGVQANKRVLPLVPEFKLRVQISGCCEPQALLGLERKRVLAKPWTPPEGAIMSVAMPCIPAGSKLLSISTQGVQPDAMSGFRSTEVSPPWVPFSPGVSGYRSPEVSPPWVPSPPCPAFDPKPRSDLVPSGVLTLPPGADKHECERLAFQAMSQYPPGRLPTEVVYDVLRRTPEVLPARTRGAKTDATHQWFSGAGDMVMDLWSVYGTAP